MSDNFHCNFHLLRIYISSLKDGMTNGEWWLRGLQRKFLGDNSVDGIQR